MNKLLVFPMSFMFILSIFAMLYNGQSYYGEVNEKGTAIYADGRTYNDLTPTEKLFLNGSIELQNGKMSLQNLASVVAILVLAMALAGLAGLNIFGSGLSIFSQKLIFTATLFGGIWACLSINSYLVIFKDNYSISTYLWLLLTVMYVIGIGIQIDSGSVESG